MGLGPPDWIYDDLRQFETSHTDAKRQDVAKFEALLSTNPGEHACQAFLKAHPALLAAYGRSGHGEWVIPKPRFGSQYVPDFVIGHGHSGGLFWTLVEIEAPTHRPFKKDGAFSAPLHHAIEQIQSWRSWIEPNISYVHNRREEGGLGLFDLRARARAMIVIGRRCEYPPRYNDLRRQWYENFSLDIMSYDRFLDNPRRQAAFWDQDPMERLVRSLSNFDCSTSAES